jgi:hypothetical protein
VRVCVWWSGVAGISGCVCARARALVGGCMDNKLLNPKPSPDGSPEHVHCMGLCVWDAHLRDNISTGCIQREGHVYVVPVQKDS